jgi:ASC-1-like (ASCH) protein
MNSKEGIISRLRKCLSGEIVWLRKLSSKSFTLHLAIFQEPYLSYIMEGRKKIETRFARRPCPPFNRVSIGDVVLLKESGGEIVGVCEVEEVWFYKLDPNALKFIKQNFGELICPADGSFWREREDKSVATLMKVKNVMPITGVQIKKRDRRGWVTFNEEPQELLF